jgi:hypothetical protein
VNGTLLHYMILYSFVSYRSFPIHLNQSSLLPIQNIPPILNELNILLQIIHTLLHTPILDRHLQLLPLHPRLFVTDVLATTTEEAFGGLGSGGSGGHLGWVFEGYEGWVFGVGGLSEDFTPVLACGCGCGCEGVGDCGCDGGGFGGKGGSEVGE